MSHMSSVSSVTYPSEIISKKEFREMFKKGDYIEHHWPGTDGFDPEIRRGYITELKVDDDGSLFWGFGKYWVIDRLDISKGHVKYFPPEEYPEYYI